MPAITPPKVAPPFELPTVSVWAPSVTPPVPASDLTVPLVAAAAQLASRRSTPPAPSVRSLASSTRPAPVFTNTLPELTVKGPV